MSSTDNEIARTVRNKVLEEAAKLCEARAAEYYKQFAGSAAPEEEDDLLVAEEAAKGCAFAIRALIEKELPE